MAPEVEEVFVEVALQVLEDRRHWTMIRATSPAEAFRVFEAQGLEQFEPEEEQHD